MSFSDSYGAPTAPLVQPEPVSQYPTYSDGPVTYDTPVTFPQQTAHYPSSGPYQAPGGKTLFFQFTGIEIELPWLVYYISDTYLNHIMLIYSILPTWTRIFWRKLPYNGDSSYIGLIHVFFVAFGKIILDILK